MSKGFPDFSLSRTRLPALLLFLTCTAIPELLWAGSLTPRLSSRTTVINAPLARTGVGSYDFLQPMSHNPINNGCLRTNQENGTFTNCPGLYLSARLLESARSPSVNFGGNPRIHPKPDNSGYRYSGRSYGVGSSVGLTFADASLAAKSGTDPPLYYTFSETGYLATITCGYNASSHWLLTNALLKPPPGGFPYQFYAKGKLPNANQSAPDDFFAQLDLDPTAANVLAVGDKLDPTGYGGKIAIAAGPTYALLDKLQCDVTFTPTLFAINASTPDLLITVTPLPTSAPDPEPRRELLASALRSIGTVSLVQTTLYVSILGEALLQNILSFGGNLSTPGSAAVLAATQAAFEAILDDNLGLLQATALTQPAQYADAPVVVTVGAFKIGTPRFIGAVATVHFLGGLAVVVLAVRSRLYGRAPRADFANIGTMVVGAHNGAVGMMAHRVGGAVAAGNWVADQELACATVQIVDAGVDGAKRGTAVRVERASRLSILK